MAWCLKFFCSLWVLVMISVVTGAEVPKGGLPKDGLPKGSLVKLGSDQYKVRESAYVELKKWSLGNDKSSPELLHKEWRRSPDPEVRARCFSLMRGSLIQREFGRGEGFVGISMKEFLVPVKAGEKPRLGVRIDMVLPKTPAQKAGLKLGDVVLGVDALYFSKLPQNDAKLGAVTSFITYIKSKHPDDVITLHLMRGGKRLDQKVTLMKRPASADGDFAGRSLAHKRKKEEARLLENWLKRMDTKTKQ